MATTTTDKTFFPKITELMENVKAHFAEKEDKFKNLEEALYDYIRVKRYWPALQTKRFFGRNGLVLLHNTYKRTDIEAFKELYEEARSVVLDLTAPDGNNIVVSLADKIPERMSLEEYKQRMKDTDRCETAFEGTMIYAYYHDDKWLFGTSTCPTVYSSRYFHPTKTHGKMMDEVLEKMYPQEKDDSLSTLEQSKKLRSSFTDGLNRDYTYGFMLVHHENRHVMDYTDLLGEDYKVLYHIFTRDKKSKVSYQEDIGLPKPKVFNSPKDALSALEEDKNLFAIIVRTESGDLYKVSLPEVIQKEAEDLGNANPWTNMLWVYMQNNPEYTVHHYTQKYLGDKKESLMTYSKTTGRNMSPTYVIHTVMKYMADTLYGLYHDTTRYNPYTTKYHMDLEADQMRPPIIRFHLAQLRHKQITTHTHAPLTNKAIYHYLCLHNTMKNIRLLVKFFAEPFLIMEKDVEEGVGMGVIPECFIALSNGLRG